MDIQRAQPACRYLASFEIELEDSVLMQDIAKVEQIDVIPALRTCYLVENISAVVDLNVDVFLDIFNDHVLE